MSIVIEILKKNGIVVNGQSPSDIQVLDKRLYDRILSHGSLGLGEAYMEKWWECEDLGGFFYLICRARLEDTVNPLQILPHIIKARLFNHQAISRAFNVGRAHYDIGNELYMKMLDKRMVYTCGYWKNAKNLDEAQEAKLDLVCKKINLKSGMKILDVGCGWGSLLKFAAENYGAKGVGITVSQKQAELARELCNGLPIEIKICDYRKITGFFDRIVSLGMFEHVGYKNYKTYMKVLAKCLTDSGIFLLHTIGGNTSKVTTDPWIDKYIFPNGMIPSAKQITAAAEGLFLIEDWHNFGPYYDKTLMAWHNNFNKNWEFIKEHFDETFYRMWKYYLLSCAGAFRARSLQLWQIVLSKNGLESGYDSIR